MWLRRSDQVAVKTLTAGYYETYTLHRTVTCECLLLLQTYFKLHLLRSWLLYNILQCRGLRLFGLIYLGLALATLQPGYSPFLPDELPTNSHSHKYLSTAIQNLSKMVGKYGQGDVDDAAFGLGCN